MENQKILRWFLGVLVLMAGLFAGATNVRAEQDCGKIIDMMEATKCYQRELNLLNDIMNMREEMEDMPTSERVAVMRPLIRPLDDLLSDRAAAYSGHGPHGYSGEFTAARADKDRTHVAVREWKRGCEARFMDCTNQINDLTERAWRLQCQINTTYRGEECGSTEGGYAGVLEELTDCEKESLCKRTLSEKKIEVSALECELGCYEDGKGSDCLSVCGM